MDSLPEAGVAAGRFTRSVCPNDDTTSGRGERLLRCGISTRLMTARGQKRLLPQRNLVVRSSSMSGLPTPELWGCTCIAKAESLTLTATKIFMAGKAKRRAWTEADVRSKKKTSAGRIAKSLKRTVGAYETESILSWGFVRFSRIGKSSFSFRRNLPDHTAVKAVSRSAISGEHR
jgi:hypothetical protein